MVLNTNILPFWKYSVFDEQTQRFWGYVNQRGFPDRTKPLNAILFCRMLWAYSAEFEHSGDSRCLTLAHAAYKTLQTSFIDPLFGGVFYQIRADYTPLVLQKRTFAQALSIISLARYAKATGNKEALSEAKKIHGFLLHYAQIERGGFTDTLARDWQDEKDDHIWWMNRNGARFIFNSQLHMLEAAIELYRAEPSNEIRTQINSQITFISNYFANPTTGHLSVSVADRTKTIDETVSFPNELEASYLIRRAARLSGDLPKVDLYCTELVRKSMDLGFDKTYGGMFFSWHEKEGFNRCKVWFVQAEAIVALLDAFEASGDSFFLHRVTLLWDYIEEHLIDWKDGEWFASANNPYTDEKSVQQQKARDNRTGKEKVSAFKCPYHTVRTCLEIEKRVNRIISWPSELESTSSCNKPSPLRPSRILQS
jgi:mannobiose 2-epimerase